MTQVRAASPALSPLAEPTRKVGKRWIALIALANLGLSLGYLGPLGVLLPNQVQAIAGSAHKVAVLGWVTGIGAAVAMISNPVAGALSDRTTGRFGRRHPWTVCGALAGAAALVLLAGQQTIAGLLIGWCLAQAGLNAMQASLTAAVPNHVPVAQRGVVSGWIGVPQTVSAVLAVALVTLAVTGDAGYVLLAALMVACALPFALTTPDARLPATDRPPFAVREFARSFWLSPATVPRLRMGMADPLGSQSRQRHGRLVPAVLPARQGSLQPPVSGSEGREWTAHSHPCLHGRGRHHRGDRWGDL